MGEVENNNFIAFTGKWGQGRLLPQKKKKKKKCAPTKENLVSSFMVQSWGAGNISVCERPAPLEFGHRLSS